ncbi:MAG: SDR family oxidoreductase [Myxococcales bacterium]|nr:SDR family oxidoreductase [Myxococcales bacterium]MCB9523908.1 SDR family oxidoreductase [Myxococcales bacterium]
MEGMTCLVTGATSGIGEITAQALAQAGADLFLVARNADKAKALVDRLKAQTGNDRITALIGDLSRQADVRRVAAEFKAQRDRLDRLVNNAGGAFTERKVTDDGFEYTWALNHLAYFLLTLELQPLLAATPGARVVCTASDAHKGGKLVWDDLQYERRRYGTGTLAYCQSKLANVLFAREAARRFAEDGITVNSVHPGYVASGFALNNGPVVKFGQWLGKPFARSPEKGAETVIWATVDPGAATLNGEYLMDKKVRRPSARGRDDEAAARLWELSLTQVGG